MLPALSELKRIAEDLGVDLALDENDPAGSWQAGWATLAEQCPQAFIWHPHRLGRERSGLALAFLFARQAAPEQVPLFHPLAAEAEAISYGRGLLHSLTKLPGLAGPCRVYCFSPATPGLGPLQSLPGYANQVAWSLAPIGRLRRHVLLDQATLGYMRSWPDAAIELAGLILHEELHAALARATNTNGQSYSPLVGAVEEAVVALLDLLVVCWLFTDEIVPGLVLRGAALDHTEVAAITALVDMFSTDDGQVLAERAIALAIAALQYPEQLLDQLNQLAEPTDITGWLIRLGAAERPMCFQPR